MGPGASSAFNAFLYANDLNNIPISAMAIIFLPMMIWNILVCLFGYKLFKVQLAISGFLLGGLLGAVLASTSDEAVFVVLLGLALGALGAWLALKLYKLGLFIAIATGSTLVFIILFGLLIQDFNLGVVFVALIFGISLGVFGVMIDKIIIIFYTAIVGGLLAGITLGICMSNLVLGIFFGVLLAIFGMLLQFRMERKNGGQPAVLTAAPVASLAAAPVAPLPVAPPPVQDNIVKNQSASVRGATNSLVSAVYKHEPPTPNQTVLVSNKGSYWCKDMPLVITEVQIVKQNEDDEHVYLNIALQNLSDQAIVGIYFDVACYNILKQELEGLNNLPLLDLSIAKGQHWVTTNFICLPDNTTRKCLLMVKNIVLKNEDIWSNEQSLPLTDIPTAAALALSNELAEEYHSQLAEQQNMPNTTAVYTYAPSFSANYWHCSCGQLNTTANRCICCAIEKTVLASLFNESKLQLDREHRIAEQLRMTEERRRTIAEQAEAARQKALEQAVATKQRELEQAEAAKQRELEQAEATKQRMLELANQAKQGYIVAATKTTQLYGMATKNTKSWFSSTSAFMRMYRMPMLVGAISAVVVVAAGFTIIILLF